MTTSSLEETAARAQRGDAGALERLVRGLQDGIYRLSLRFLGHPEHARDATQEILILIVTNLATFRGESAITTWSYRIASRHLLRQKRRFRRIRFESLAEEDLGKPPNAIEPATLASADEKLLEEEVFVGCTQAMLQALDKPQRLAFVLGAICELDSAEAAAIVGISEPAFRKRLSRAREKLDSFVGKHCGVASAANRCRCVYQVNHNVATGRLDPAQLRFASPAARPSLDGQRALAEIHRVRRSLELYRAQPSFAAPADFASQIRKVIAGTASLSQTES
jgi:RNA polymerase sigma factor (sigma-70 family)